LAVADPAIAAGTSELLAAALVGGSARISGSRSTPSKTDIAVRRLPAASSAASTATPGRIPAARTVKNTFDDNLISPDPYASGALCPHRWERGDLDSAPQYYFPAVRNDFAGHDSTVDNLDTPAVVAAVKTDRFFNPGETIVRADL